MNIIKKFFANTRKPRNTFSGRLMLSMMNSGHNKMALWCINEHIILKGTEDILDIGCGGGQNIAHLLKCTSGKVFGLDYSSASVAKSVQKNKKAINAKRTKVVQGEVSSIPFGKEEFDIVTAFETIYFWPDILNDFKAVYRVLKPGGRFFICNEMEKEHAKSERWTKIIDMQIYSAEEIVSLMLESGFKNVIANKKGDKKTICIIGQKNENEKPLYND